MGDHQDILGTLEYETEKHSEIRLWQNPLNAAMNVKGICVHKIIRSQAKFEGDFTNVDYRLFTFKVYI